MPPARKPRRRAGGGDVPRQSRRRSGDAFRQPKRGAGGSDTPGRPKRGAGGGDTPDRQRRTPERRRDPGRHAGSPADPHRPSGERLQKVLATAGVASRRVAEDLITAGRVEVNGSVVTTLGTRVDPRADRISVDGRRIATDPDKVYVVLNKPEGVLTTMRDERSRPAVADLVRTQARVYPVGRLDADTQGVLLMTNDGELAHRLAHPRWGVERVYRAEVLGAIERVAVDRLLEGVRIDDGPAKALRARIVARRGERSHVEIVMGEGRKREVRRMLDAVGHPVVRLVRRAYGPIGLGSLRPGAWRELTPAEVGALKQLVDL